VNYVDIWGDNVLGRGISECKGSGVHPVGLRNGKETTVISMGKEGEVGRKHREDEGDQSISGLWTQGRVAFTGSGVGFCAKKLEV
jgi:hypothetical protein